MRQQPNVKYLIYPSLLDGFQRYLDTTPENFMYQGEDGKWHMNYSESTDEYQYSSEQVEEMSKQQLIDKINRVKFESDAATRGTVFNELVDCFVNKKRSETVKMEGHRSTDSITTELNGKVFDFSFSFVENYAGTLEGATNQLYVKAPIETDYGNVLLYGYIDEVKEDKVIDIKTTTRYQFGDFNDHWQRHVYPYCLIESGKMQDISSFVYSVVVLKGGTSRTPLISGNVFNEEYTYDHSQSRSMLKSFLERFIEFLNDNRDKITDKKIFNEHQQCIVEVLRKPLLDKDSGELNFLRYGYKRQNVSRVS